MSRTFLAFVLTSAFLSSIAFAQEVVPGRFGADVIFVHPVVGRGGVDTFRAQLEVVPFRVDTTFAKMEFLDAEVQGSVAVGSGEVALTRVRATALRMAFSYVMPVDIGTFYRNMDQGIDWGAEFVSVRVPIKILQGGQIMVQPGLEMGVHHYIAPVNRTSFHTSFSVEARAAVALVQNWLSTGIMAKVKLDLDTANMTGFEEEAMGYLSLVLNREHKLYARLYAGIDHQQIRDEVGLPTVNVFGGLGIFGNFGGNFGGPSGGSSGR